MHVRRLCKLTNENLILKLRLSKLEGKAKMSVNKSIPRCKENSQTTAPTDDSDDNALAYYTGTNTFQIRFIPIIDIRFLSIVKANPPQGGLTSSE